MFFFYRCLFLFTSAAISCRRVSVRLSVCLSQVGVLLKRLNVHANSATR